MQDVAERVYQRLCLGEQGKANQPNVLLFFVFVHHAMGIGMVVPMNLYYSSNAR